MGCFGEALLRKFGAEPPQEWTDALRGLAMGQLERGMRRVVFGWKGGPPSLPDFIRLCRTVGTDEFDEGESDRQRLPAPDSFNGDAWTMAANRYLLGHIATRMSQNPKFYGQPASYKAMRARQDELDLLGLDKHNLDASPVFIENVHALVAAKNAWADDMRDLAVDGGVPVETQKAVWRDWIGRAEEGMRR